ncbi:ROK family transcriptional regulator [Streptomyces sp. DSM 44917]|uniref:ROK family transcriptional regulator n=1 Tax=Streptomyces boetiae TaxID=3075541 RepID=A0ABU2LCX9_9ACTN|nr:ROK family transcriptional regulator [Streptomyces sp. DSM 44917]MDT0309441.1 ROK family transcriptional regulator [Streptomyces sp. DSM 44917]
MTTARIASPRTARAINDRIALELLAERGPLTAAALKDLTGLSRPSVADLLERLARDGLVAVVGEDRGERRGPRARVYGLVAGRAHVAALDVRAEGVTFAVANLAGETVGRAALPVPGGGPGDERPEAVVARVADALGDTLRAAGVSTLHTTVMGAPGLADPATGALRASGSLPRWHRLLPGALRTRQAGRVLVENEVNLAGIAEHRLGAVRDRDTFVLLWLGAGVGAAVVLDGALRRGASGGAGEIGFLPVPGTGGLPGAADCEGGFHALAGGAAVLALARRHGLDATDAEAAVARAAAADSGPGAAFLDELAGRVALGLAGVAAVLDPGCAVLGGETGRAGGEALAGRVERRLRELSPLETQVRAAVVGGSPVLGGGLLTALDTARRDLFGGPGPETASASPAGATSAGGAPATPPRRLVMPPTARRRGAAAVAD